VLTREEAALCLGLADGVVENLEQSDGLSPLPQT
jgi:hypothetical protein